MWVGQVTSLFETLWWFPIMEVQSSSHGLDGPWIWPLPSSEMHLYKILLPFHRECHTCIQWDMLIHTAPPLLLTNSMSPCFLTPSFPPAVATSLSGLRGFHTGFTSSCSPSSWSTVTRSSLQTGLFCPTLKNQAIPPAVFLTRPCAVSSRPPNFVNVSALLDVSWFASWSASDLLCLRLYLVLGVREELDIIDFQNT